jgi:calcineurin-like phosphoesterase
MPALVSAPAKKSFSSASSPILACSDFKSTIGACCDYDPVIGMEKFEPVQRFTREISSSRYSPATGPATLCAVFVETDTKGLAVGIEPVRVGGRLKPNMPAF